MAITSAIILVKNWGNNINQLINYVAITSATIAITSAKNETKWQ